MRMNILNKQGMLTDEDRKQPLEHGCDHVTFRTCLDLSQGVKVESYGGADLTVDMYSRDLASFMIFWTTQVWGDLNGFGGLYNAKFELDFKIIPNNQ